MEEKESKAICSECGCPIDIVNGEEWAYCPMCDNDQVEVARHKQITDLQSQLAITEKALELACKEITGSCEYCSYKTRIECPVEADCLDEKINYFKTKAKEMMKSE